MGSNKWRAVEEKVGRTRRKLKVKTRIRRWFRNLLYVDARLMAAAGVIAAVAVLVGGGTMYKHYMAVDIDPTVYTPLLNTIAKGESRGNYNAYYGHSDNTTIRFTDMSVADVLKWQQEFVAQGHASSAVGKYQLIQPTLASLVSKLHVDPGARFDEKLQDTFAVALLEKRGARDYMENKMSRQDFAANLAKEWAALPKATGTNPEKSYYAGDGINKEQITISEIYTALASIKTTE
jgi:muramidase (phage lysozyme)